MFATHEERKGDLNRTLKRLFTILSPKWGEIHISGSSQTPGKETCKRDLPKTVIDQTYFPLHISSFSLCYKRMAHGEQHITWHWIRRSENLRSRVSYVFWPMRGLGGRRWCNCWEEGKCLDSSMVSSPVHGMRLETFLHFGIGDEEERGRKVDEGNLSDCSPGFSFLSKLIFPASPQKASLYSIEWMWKVTSHLLCSGHFSIQKHRVVDIFGNRRKKGKEEEEEEEKIFGIGSAKSVLVIRVHPRFTFVTLFFSLFPAFFRTIARIDMHQKKAGRILELKRRKSPDISEIESFTDFQVFVRCADDRASLL